MFRRLSIAKEIFTKEEVDELIKYEFFQLFEISKQHIEWIIYAIVILIWIDVAALTIALVKVGKTEETYYVDKNIEKPVVKEKMNEKGPARKLAEEVSSLSNYNSSLDPVDLTSKIIVHAFEWKIDPCFLLALIENETAGTFDENIKASDYKWTNSVGWSQMTKPTLDWFNAQYVWLHYEEAWDENDMKNPDKALTAICWYLNKLKEMKATDIKNNRDLYYYYNGGPNKPSPYSINASKQALTNAEKVMNLYKKYFVALK